MTNREHEPTTDRRITHRLDSRHYGDDLEDEDRPVPAHVGPAPDEPETDEETTYEPRFIRASELLPTGASDEEVSRAVENIEGETDE